MSVIDINDRVLVIGAAGLLGRAMVAELERQGFAAILTPNSRELDCLDPAATRGYFEREKPTVVFHLAAVVFGLKGNLDNQFLSLTRNTLINHNVLTACAATSVRKTFFAGTVACYAFPYVRLPLDENDLLAGPPHGGEFGYASAKRHALAYLEVMKADLGLDFVYGALTNLYGPGDKFDVTNGHVIPSLIRKAGLASEQGGPFEVWGKPSTTRDYLYAPDAAAGVIHLMRTEASGVINIASGHTSMLGDVVDAIRTYFPTLPSTTWRSDMPVGIPERSVSVSRLRAAGFTATRSLESGIQATCEWYLQNKNSIRL